MDTNLAMDSCKETHQGSSTRLVPIRLGLVLLLVLLPFAGQAKSTGDGHAPCYDCEMYNVMNRDQPHFEKQVGKTLFYVL